MNLPPMNRTHLHVSADLEITLEPADRALTMQDGLDALTLTGRLVQQRSQRPLPGLQVIALGDLPARRAGKLGLGVSDAEGRFQIGFNDSREARERLLALRHVPQATLTLRVLASDGAVLHTSAPILVDRAQLSVTLAVPMQLPPPDTSDWTTLAMHLKASRSARLHDVVRQLGADGAISEAADGSPGLPVPLRQALLDGLEQAFLDPTGALHHAAAPVPTLAELQDPEFVQRYGQGLQQAAADSGVSAAWLEARGRAASFSSLAEVDWPIDLDALSQGDIGGAVNRFSQRYRISDHITLPFLGIDSDLTVYRDYLLAIWTTYATKVAYSENAFLTPDQALAQLETRFHQRFTTHDDAARPANAVLAGIVSEVLQAPTGKGWGFGVAAATITPQGARSMRAYLDFLIGLSGISASEFGLRYRLDLRRDDGAASSPVQQNIDTLQAFFRDSFQWEADPVHVEPDKHDQPIIPDVWLGKAPFFLYYDEWQRQREPFYAENHIDLRGMLPVNISDLARSQLADMAAGKIAGQLANVKHWQFCQQVIGVWDALQAGHGHFQAGEYGLALADYRTAEQRAQAAVQANILQKEPLNGFYNQRKALPLKGMKDVPGFMNPAALAAGGFGYADSPDYSKPRMALRLAYYALFTIPICLGDAEAALGDYEHAVFHYGQATRFELCVARESDGAGYRNFFQLTNEPFEPYWQGDKPYSVVLREAAVPGTAAYPRTLDEATYDQNFGGIFTALEDFAYHTILRIPHQAEKKYCKLRQGAVMLDWADALYKLNEPTAAARARELYKGVLWLHGRIPPIGPSWPHRFGGLPGFLQQAENPAIRSQWLRAHRGLYQIDNGLNWYGERDDIVPMLRYRPLKDLADRQAAMARGAQQDFLLYTERVEAAMTARLQLANFLQKAKLQSAIASEQQQIAQNDVAVAQAQVAVVEAAIAAKQAEIADHESLFGQLSDAFKSVKAMVGDLPDDTKSAVAAPFESAFTGKEMVGQGMLGLGASASIMTGFGIFAVVGYVTLSGMASAANQRQAELATLAGKALPAAQAAVVARQHGVAITQYQKLIAQADIDLAQTLLAFEQNRILNQGFWLQLAQVARRMLRRYLDLGARSAWLAERALAYEQDRRLRIVRMDYFAARLQGVTGADLMQADLAELEATRIEGMKRTVPVRRSVSLARDFPLQFGQLKKTGRAAFHTTEAEFRRAYPGSFGYRVRAVTVAVQQRDYSQPLRGSLLNRGVSLSKPGLPGEHVLIRPAEALPLSEFRLQNDMAVYGLPNESLLTFEGSNVESFWELGFPKAANAAGLDGLVDVLISFDMSCEFAPQRYEAELLALPADARKWLLVSGAQFQADALAALVGAARTVDLVFDLKRLRLLPRQEAGRKITNLALLAVAPDGLDFAATLKAAQPALAVPVSLVDGYAVSAVQPVAGMLPMPASTLDGLVGLDPEQAFTLSIDKGANAGVDFSQVRDLVLAVEYESTLA